MSSSEEDDAQGMPTLNLKRLPDVLVFYREGETKEGIGCIFWKQFFKDMCTKCIYFPLSQYMDIGSWELIFFCARGASRGVIA